MVEISQSHELNKGHARTVNTKPGIGETRACIDPWRQPLIHPNGDVWPCCWFYASLGNLNDEPFDKIMNGPEFQKLRQELLTGQLRKACVECPSRSLTTPDRLLHLVRGSRANR